MTGRFILEDRRPVVVNTDPLGRCYDGAHFSAETRWTPWGRPIPYRDEVDARSAMKTFQKINPAWQFRVRPEEGAG